jgi:hypothetical protein
MKHVCYASRLDPCPCALLGLDTEEGSNSSTGQMCPRWFKAAYRFTEVPSFASVGEPALNVCSRPKAAYSGYKSPLNKNPAEAGSQYLRLNYSMHLEPFRWRYERFRQCIPSSRLRSAATVGTPQAFVPGRDAAIT